MSCGGTAEALKLNSDPFSGARITGSPSLDSFRGRDGDSLLLLGFVLIVSERIMLSFSLEL